ncbi:hypothetical protein M378DRAFT_169459 [Amanita muscaria Koide BX008]|uniref:Uncharacterized protein n=1 Tax=Amanita muscaria (strain Koide BX008) TaxID=946122 RepID=A0A0C2WSH4_AMAMK|nr:hypothetical protein M378DRAFT_169459 [Amanita muscaria Koide BX008]
MNSSLVHYSYCILSGDHLLHLRHGPCARLVDVGMGGLGYNSDDAVTCMSFQDSPLLAV